MSELSQDANRQLTATSPARPPLRGSMYEWMDTYEMLCQLLQLPKTTPAATILDEVKCLLNAREQMHLFREAVPDWAERIFRHQQSSDKILSQE